jgi:hypothetical protein
LVLTDYHRKAAEMSASGLSVNSLALRSASVNRYGISSGDKYKDDLAVSVSETELRREDLPERRRDSFLVSVKVIEGARPFFGFGDGGRAIPNGEAFSLSSEKERRRVDLGIFCAG